MIVGSQLLEVVLHARVKFASREDDPSAFFTASGDERSDDHESDRPTKTTVRMISPQPRTCLDVPSVTITEAAIRVFRENPKGSNLPLL